MILTIFTMAQVIPCYALEKAQNLRPKTGEETKTAAAMNQDLQATTVQNQQPDAAAITAAGATGTASDVTKNTMLEIGGYIYQASGDEYHQFEIIGIKGQDIACRNLYSNNTKTFQRTDFNVRIGGGWRYIAPGTISIEEAIAADTARMAAFKTDRVNISATPDKKVEPYYTLKPFSRFDLLRLRNFIRNNRAFPEALLRQDEILKIDKSGSTPIILQNQSYAENVKARLALALVSGNVTTASIAKSLLETIENTPAAMLNDDKTNANVNYATDVRKIATAIENHVTTALATDKDKLSSEVISEIAIKTTAREMTAKGFTERNGGSSQPLTEQDAEIVALNIVLNQKIAEYRQLASQRSALVLDDDETRKTAIVRFLIDEMGFRAENVHTAASQQTYDLVINNTHVTPTGIDLGNAYQINVFAMSNQIDIENNKRIIERWLRSQA